MDCFDRYQWALNNTRIIMAHGGPGLGKTHTAYHDSLKGRELFAMTLGEESSATELRGHFISKGAEGTVWHDGPATRAARAQGRFVINEISHAGPDVQGLLYALCEEPSTARLTLPTGETVEVGEEFQLILTDNHEPDAALSPAMLDRIEAFVRIDKPHPAALLTVSEPLRKYAENAISQGISGLRAWQHLTNHLAKGLDGDVAQELAFGKPDEVLATLIQAALVEYRDTAAEEAVDRHDTEDLDEVSEPPLTVEAAPPNAPKYDGVPF